MFIARFFLGFGIGPKSATTRTFRHVLVLVVDERMRLMGYLAIFAAECAPPKVRGALVMQ